MPADRPGRSTALLNDLKQRGLLDDTLVVWGGEFGRTPMNEARNGSKFLGRDHHPRAFTMWMAGGGIKPGVTIGETDELGYNVVEDPVDVHDLHATMLHLLGLDHEKLTYKFQGRDFRLTDVHGKVVHEAARLDRATAACHGAGGAGSAGTDDTNTMTGSPGRHAPGLGIVPRPNSGSSAAVGSGLQSVEETHRVSSSSSCLVSSRREAP